MELSQESAAMISTAATVIMVIVTTYYAILTHRILKYQKDIAKLEFRPFLKFESIYPVIHKEDDNSPIRGVVIGIKLKNISRVMLNYHMSKFNVVINGCSNDDTVFLNSGGYVYPDQMVDYSYSLIPITGDVPDVLQGELEYEYIYYSTDKIKYQSVRKYAFFIYHRSNRIEWKSLYEHESEC